MLVITNGRVLVDPAMNEASMEKFIENLTKNVNDLFDISTEFERIDKPFLQYKIPEALPLKNLIDSLPSDGRIEFFAIGKDDEVQLPYSIHKTIKHPYAVEELQEIADKMCQYLSEISELDAEKKAHAKRLGDQINDLSEQLRQEAQRHRQGYEMRDKRVFVVMNFKEQMKYYHEVGSFELLQSEVMNEQDQRSLFDIRGVNPDADLEAMKGFEIGIPDMFDEEDSTNMEDIEKESEKVEAIDIEEV